MESGDKNAVCRCGKAALWRCLQCIGGVHTCARCLRDAHTLLPFHRVEFWSENSWRAAWLRTVDVQIHLGHSGGPCPSLNDIVSSDEQARSSPNATSMTPSPAPSVHPDRPVASLPRRSPLHGDSVPLCHPHSQSHSAPPLSRRLNRAKHTPDRNPPDSPPEHNLAQDPPAQLPAEYTPEVPLPENRSLSSASTNELYAGSTDGHGTAVRANKRSAAQAELEPLTAGPELTAEEEGDVEDEQEVDVEEDDDPNTVDATRFDVAAADACDMPHIEEPVLKPFPTLHGASNRRKPRYGSTLTMVVVDISGVHELPVVFCGCANAASRDIQLMHMGLYPATWRRPQTAFTFSVLDDFLLTNKECKTPALSYYSRLRRITSDTFPHMVPVSPLCQAVRRSTANARMTEGSLP